MIMSRAAEKIIEAEETVNNAAVIYQAVHKKLSEQDCRAQR